MFYDIDIQNFIKSKITGRQNSLLQADLDKYHSELNKNIEGKNVLVIGGAGSIGSSYIKAILKFRIAKLVVVDTDDALLICRKDQAQNVKQVDDILEDKGYKELI